MGLRLPLLRRGHDGWCVVRYLRGLGQLVLSGGGLLMRLAGCRLLLGLLLQLLLLLFLL